MQTLPLTTDALRQCMPAASNARLAIFLPYLNAFMAKYEINTVSRAAMFIAQVGHECGDFRFLEEIWGPTDAQKRYEGRRDLGNVEKGDGARFKGRGAIQITGRANYEAVGKFFGIDFVGNPELLETPEWAIASAVWFWHKNGLNALADAGKFETITRRINGGLNGYADRLRRHELANAAFGALALAHHPEGARGALKAARSGGEEFLS